MTVKTIKPTHTCFDDAIEIMEAIVKVDPSICFGNELLLVHAVGLKADGKRFSHAWLEMDGMAIFRGIVDGKRMELSAPRRQYYHSLKLQQLTRYNCRQVRDENVKSGHFGPWIEPYISLCKDPEKNPTYQNKNERTTMPISCGQGSAPGIAPDARTHQRFACLKGKQIGIHASQTWDPNAMLLARHYLTAERAQATRLINPHKYYGRILCTAECYGFNLLDGADAPLAMIETKTKRWGNYLTLVKPFKPFIKARGYQGIWNYEIAA